MKMIYKIVITCCLINLTGCKPPPYTVYEATIPNATLEKLVIPEVEGTKETASIRNFSGAEEKGCKNFYKIGTQKNNYNFSTTLYLKLVQDGTNILMFVFVNTKTQTENKMGDGEALNMLLEKLAIQNPMIILGQIGFQAVKRAPEVEYKEPDVFFNEVCNR